VITIMLGVPLTSEQAEAAKRAAVDEKLVSDERFDELMLGARTLSGAHVIDLSFNSIDEWEHWLSKNQELFSKRYIEKCLDEVSRHGLWLPFPDIFFVPEKIDFELADPREGIAAGLTISRTRAVLRALGTTINCDYYNTKIYAPEAITPFAELMRSNFVKFLGSEYAKDEAAKRELYPIRAEDLTALTLPDDVFDVVITNEVLEHVADIDAALKEMHRVLKSGGWHIGTCPFRDTSYSSEKRSILRDGNTVYLEKPEWHGDPLTKSGSLVFEVPGWDILDRAKSIGFSETTWRFIHSITFGILSKLCGVFVLCLRK
jgi:SAM-dependent methyltransferase